MLYRLLAGTPCPMSQFQSVYGGYLILALERYMVYGKFMSNHAAAVQLL